MKLNILMVQKQNLINLNWKPTQMVVEPFFFTQISQIHAEKWVKICWICVVIFLFLSSISLPQYTSKGYHSYSSCERRRQFWNLRRKLGDDRFCIKHSGNVYIFEEKGIYLKKQLSETNLRLSTRKWVHIRRFISYMY